MPLILVLALASYAAWAAPFAVANRSSDLNSANPAHAAILSALNTAADEVEGTVNNGFLSETSQANFTSSMAKANTSSSSSLIGDRASNATTWLSNLGLQAAFNSSSESIPSSSSTDNSLPSFGVGAQASLLVGINAAKLGFKKMGPFDPKRMTLLMNGFFFRKTVSNVSLSLFNMGLNAQYKLLEPKSKSYWLSWGGLTFLTGLNFQTLSADYSSNITQTGTEPVGGETATINVDMDYSLGVKSTDFFLPLEFSTNVRFLYLFTLYGGASADFNLGSSQLTGSATGPISATYSTTVPGVSNLYSATGTLDLTNSVSQSPPILVGRGFAGLQLNFWALKFAVEATALSNGTLGGAAALKASI